ncbi:hypothetical protein D3C81_1436520 [compost metagenome]
MRLDEVRIAAELDGRTEIVDEIVLELIARDEPGGSEVEQRHPDEHRLSPRHQGARHAADGMPLPQHPLLPGDRQHGQARREERR